MDRKELPYLPVYKLQAPCGQGLPEGTHLLPRRLVGEPGHSSSSSPVLLDPAHFLMMGIELLADEGGGED